MISICTYKGYQAKFEPEAEDKTVAEAAVISELIAIRSCLLAI